MDDIYALIWIIRIIHYIQHITTLYVEDYLLKRHASFPYQLLILLI